MIVRTTTSTINALAGGLAAGALIVTLGVVFSSKPGQPRACQTPATTTIAEAAVPQ